MGLRFHHYCSLKMARSLPAVLPAVMKTVTRCLRSAVKTNSEYRAMKTKGGETGTNGEETENQLLLHSWWTSDGENGGWFWQRQWGLAAIAFGRMELRCEALGFGFGGMAKSGNNRIRIYIKAWGSPTLQRFYHTPVFIFCDLTKGKF